QPVRVAVAKAGLQTPAFRICGPRQDSPETSVKSRAIVNVRRNLRGYHKILSLRSRLSLLSNLPWVSPMNDPNEMSDDPKAWELACTCVGRFFSHWSALENLVRNAIEALFEMQGLSASIILANTTTRDKFYILKTGFSVFGAALPPEW